MTTQKNLYELTTSYHEKGFGRTNNYRGMTVVAESMDKAISKVRKALTKGERVEEVKVIRWDLDAA